MSRKNRTMVASGAGVLLWLGAWFLLGCSIGWEEGGVTLFGVQAGLMVLGLNVVVLAVFGLIAGLIAAAAIWVMRGDDD